MMPTILSRRQGLPWYWGPSQTDLRSRSDAVLEWLVCNAQGALVDYYPYSSVSRMATRQGPWADEAAESIGDGSPFLSHAVNACWERCQQVSSHSTSSSNPNVVSAARLQRETGVTVDANPYAGLARNKLEAVIRAAYNSRQMPETLLALWAKEGSHRMVTAAREIPQATTPQNAKTLFRCQVYYIDLGADHFIVTTRPPGGDNVWDDSDGAARDHEIHFVSQLRTLVASGHLSDDISTAINHELSVSPSRPYSVTPSVKFYALSLLLVDALFSRMQGNTFPQISFLSPELNYMQWNMGTQTFRQFLTSADRHRREPAHVTNGQPMSVEQWALHTVPLQGEWRQPRANAIRFLHYVESYRPIFALAMNLIKPGIEDLRPPANLA